MTMDAKLDIYSPLGSYSGRDEFQVETTLIWIRIPNTDQRNFWLVKGEAVFQEAWGKISQALEFAQQFSRDVASDYWIRYDLRNLAGEPLGVWGILIDPETCSASYHVNINHDFENDGSDLLALSEEGIWIKQNSAGHWEIDS